MYVTAILCTTHAVTHDMVRTLYILKICYMLLSYSGVAMMLEGLSCSLDCKIHIHKYLSLYLLQLKSIIMLDWHVGNGNLNIFVKEAKFQPSQYYKYCY